MIRRAFQNITANLWRRHCPDVLVRRLIGDVALLCSGCEIIRTIQGLR